MHLQARFPRLHCSLVAQRVRGSPGGTSGGSAAAEDSTTDTDAITQKSTLMGWKACYNVDSMQVEWCWNELKFN